MELQLYVGQTDITRAQRITPLHDMAAALRKRVACFRNPRYDHLGVRGLAPVALPAESPLRHVRLFVLFVQT